MMHREARKKLGSRSVRRSGIRSIRLKTGGMRKVTKASVAVSTRKLIRAAKATEPVINTPKGGNAAERRKTLRAAKHAEAAMLNTEGVVNV